MAKKTAAKKAPAKKATGKKRGPKPFQVTEEIRETVLQLGKIGATQREVAAVLRTSVATVNRYLKEILEEGHEGMKLNIRRKQMQTAMAGNVAMLIWLGKQCLGQKDKQEVDTTAVVQVKIDGQDGAL